MNPKKTAVLLLNVSVALHGAYLVLFMAGYVFQKLIWGLFGAWGEIVQMKPIISPAIVIAVAGTFALSLALNLTLRKRADRTVGVLTALFCVGAFLADRLTKAIACVYYSAVVGRANGMNAVYLTGFHENSLQFIDTFLLIFLAAGLALLPCAYCVMRFGEKENIFSKG
ncbi:MAG: hypothetical protein ACI4XA_09455 [Oscillospiraceae bacterium]